MADLSGLYGEKVRLIMSKNMELKIMTAIDRRVNKVYGKDILVRIDGKDHAPSRLTDHEVEIVDASYCGDPRTTGLKFIETTKWILVVVGAYDM